MSNGENISRKSDLEMSYRRKAKAQYKPWRPKKGKASTRVSGKKPRTGTPRKRSRGKSPSFSKAEGSTRNLVEYAFRREEEYFRKRKMELLADERYRGKFVAIVHQKIVAVGNDPRELSRVIDEKYGNVPAYIGKVTDKEEIVEIPLSELR